MKKSKLIEDLQVKEESKKDVEDSDRVNLIISVMRGEAQQEPPKRKFKRKKSNLALIPPEPQP